MMSGGSDTSTLGLYWREWLYAYTKWVCPQTENSRNRKDLFLHLGKTIPTGNHLSHRYVYISKSKQSSANSGKLQGIGYTGAQKFSVEGTFKRLYRKKNDLAALRLMKQEGEDAVVCLSELSGFWGGTVNAVQVTDPPSPKPPFPLSLPLPFPSFNKPEPKKKTNDMRKVLPYQWTSPLPPLKKLLQYTKNFYY